MKKKLFIHIGYPKTGTTTLQKHYFSKLGNKYQYINKFYGDTDFFPFKKIFNDITYRNIDEIDFKKKYEKISNVLTNDLILISHENFIFDCFIPFYDKCKNEYFVDPLMVAKNLRKLFPSDVYDVRILITIREQADLITSIYAQCYQPYYSKYKPYNSFDKFLSFYTDNERSSHPLRRLLNYQKVISFYEGLFEENNVFVLKFEELKNEPNIFFDKLNNIFSENIDYSEIKSENVRFVYEGYKKTHGLTLRFLLIEIKNKIFPNFKVNISQKQKDFLDKFIIKRNNRINKSIKIDDSSRKKIEKNFEY